MIKSSEEYHARSEDKEQIFRLIENHQHILRSLRVTQKSQENREGVGKDHYGINTFWYFRQMVQNHYLSCENLGDTDIKKLENAYRHIYIIDEQRQYFGHYFRNLFHIFKFIETSAFADKEKQEYAELVRAQLSYLELHFLFLNCLIEEGKEFRNYVSKFSLLKELPVFSFAPSARIEKIQINPTIESWQSSDR